MRLLLVGASGQVGAHLGTSLGDLGELACTTRSGRMPDGGGCEALDLSDLAAIHPLLDRVHPDVVVNAAAYTAVDQAEDEPAAARRLNADAPARLASWCADNGALLVHYSTDYVFSGEARAPYVESDATNPQSRYGWSKLEGEQAIAATKCRHLILRTAWAYGGPGRNFMDTMLQVGREREELRVVADQVGSPTPAWLIARATADILAKGVVESGVRHLVASGQTSWHGFAEAIFAEAVERGVLERAPRVVPIPSGDYPTRAARPAWSVLDNARLRYEYGLTLPDWRAALAQTFDRAAA